MKIRFDGQLLDTETLDEHAQHLAVHLHFTEEKLRNLQRNIASYEFSKKIMLDDLRNAVLRTKMGF